VTGNAMNSAGRKSRQPSAVIKGTGFYLSHCVASCCIVLQCLTLALRCHQGQYSPFVAVCCSVLHCVAVCCSVSRQPSAFIKGTVIYLLQYVAECCSMLQSVAGCHASPPLSSKTLVSLCCSVFSVLQRVAECCRVLQSVAECCSVSR